MRRRMLGILAGLLVLVVAACNGDGENQGLGKDPVTLEGLIGEGVVKDVSGKSRVDDELDELDEGKGGVVFDVQHVDRLVNKQVWLELFPTGETVTSAGKVAGNERLLLAPGTYDAHLMYKHSDVARYEGDVRGIVVHAGRTSKCEVKISAPVGMLDMRFLNDGVDINAKVTYSIYEAATEEGALPGDPIIADQSPTEQLAVPKGLYDVRAVYHETDAIEQEAWIQGIKVKGAMKRTVYDYDFAITLHGFVMRVRNFGEDVSDRSKVYFYYPGANVEFAVAVDQGPAGEQLVVKPGEYDVRVVFQPSAEQSTWGDKVLKNVKIGMEEETPAEDVEGEDGTGEEAADPEGGEAEAGAEDAAAAEGAEGAEGEEGAAEEPKAPERAQAQLIEMEIDMEIPLAVLKVQVLYGGDDVSDKATMRVINAGADKSAASAVLSVTGLSSHIIPAGDYDIALTFEEADLSGSRWFEGIVLGHGDAWEKSLDLRASK